MYARPNNVVDEVKRHIGTDKKYMIDGKEHTPTTISSLILKKIKEDVELFSNSEIASAVITVPATVLKRRNIKSGKNRWLEC